MAGMAVKYLVSENGQDHLPYTGEDGKPDHRLMGAAWAALHGGYRGNKYQGPNKAAAISRLTAIYKSENMDTPGTSESSEHAEGLKDWFEAFRAGDYGEKGVYTPEDLQHVADTYDPDFHEAPAVIGHPELNAPAYGWVAGVKHEGGKLLVKLGDDVDPTFEEMVQKGLFKKRSVSFYRKPEGLELRHIGFLGAQPPEVKGLAAIKFEEGESATIEFQEAPVAETQQKTLREELKAFFAEMFGGKAAETHTFGEAELTPLIERAVKPFQEQITKLQGELKAQATSFAEREQKIAAGEHSGRVAEAVNKLRSAGKWVPAFEKMGLKAVFAKLAKTADIVEFGEGDAKQKVTPLDALVNFLEKLPKIVPGGVKVTEGKVLEFADSARTGKQHDSRTRVDPNSEQLNELAKTKQREWKGAKPLDFGEALQQAASEHPELTIPGGAAAGAV